MTPQQFIAKWKKTKLSERSACQQHFLDLCELLDHPKPAEADPDGTSFTFERGCKKNDGENGWADVWKAGFFGWEYKGKHKDLTAAYQQLLRYREDLGNPPVLVVCDMDQFHVHTNFTNTIKKVYQFGLDGLADPENLAVLRRAFHEPELLKPGLSTAAVTEEVAARFAKIADGMRDRGVPAPDAAHFLMKLMFCMFGEDIDLLAGHTFSRVLKGSKNDPARLAKLLENLFEAMAKGGFFGAEEIPWFNGGLFADAQVIELTREEIEELSLANDRDWSSVEPSIFGTLFERTLDPAKRSQIGAHYTSRQDIETLLEPVVMAPLRREWEEVRAKCDKLWEKLQSGEKKATRRDSKSRKDHDRLLLDFIARLAHVRILDPACGSGNFLYVAIHLLLDLEKEVIAYGASRGTPLLPQVRPTQLSGIEINPYAQQLAQVVIWIGYLQWMYHNGFNPPRDPILEPIESIRCMDAILDLSDPDNPCEPEWPEADFIVGNPPFLGYSKLRVSLGHEYVEALYSLFARRVSNQSDLCCYWFEKTRAAIADKRTKRGGLLATQGIRGGKNREVLKSIKRTGDIFFAVSDRDWVLDGANVHVSIIAFDDGTECHRLLDDQRVPSINSNLTASADLTSAGRLSENAGLGYVGGFKFGSFDIEDEEAKSLLLAPALDRPQSDVVRPWLNGRDVLTRSRNMWIIDFGVDTPIEFAARYDAPFELVRKRVKPERDEMRRERRRERWWLHGETAVNLRRGLADLSRFIVTPRVAKHRVFFWLDPVTVVDGQLVAFARSDDFFFGVLHSRLHEIWALRQGTQLETRPRYTPSSCFETFPFPEPTPEQSEAIADAAKELDQLRSCWLNPPEWTKTEVLEFPGSVDGPWARYVCEPDARGIGTVRWPRVVPKDEACAKKLKNRTLTNLYNERPAWLDLAHRKLDAAVFAAYRWPRDLSDESILERLLDLNRTHHAPP